MNITVFTKANCPDCESAKRNLTALGLPFSTVDADKEGTMEAFKAMWPDVRQMPQVFIDGQRVGGLRQLQVYLANRGIIRE